MPTRYSVVCELGLEHYDDPRHGYRDARRAFQELRRLARFDHRVRSTRLRRSDRSTVEISVVVDARQPEEAYDRCNAMLRTAVHAAGSGTAGWERMQPAFRPGTDRRRGRRGTPDIHLVPERRQRVEPVRDWASATASARRLGAPPASLPPLAWMPGDGVIDLRAS